MSSAALLGGCADGVEINSPLLDAVGLSTAALSKREEPKLQPRAPLVMPPSTERLPEPGQAPPAATAAAADPAWPKDKDQERAAAAAQKKSRQAEYCRDGNWQERAMDSGYGHTVGPDGVVCGSIFGMVGDWLRGSPSKDAETRP
ncbi:MAG: hypothetical protein ACK4TL_03895 [Hyphomicrobiaceae bacterium]